MSLLHRQISPAYFRNGRVSWKAFKPRPADQGGLSVNCGKMVSAQQAYETFVAIPHPKTPGTFLKSDGVRSVSREECAGLERPVVQSTSEGGDASHHLIDFNPLGEEQVEACAQSLSEFAEARGWQYQPESTEAGQQSA